MSDEPEVKTLHPDIKRLHTIGKAIAESEGELPVVEHGTDPWKAWRQWRKDRGIPCGFMDLAERWTVVTIWPPGDLDSLERECASKGRKGGLSKKTLELLDG